MAGTALCDLGQEMLPFKLELTACHRDLLDGAQASNLASVEAVTPSRSFVVNCAEVCRYGTAREPMRQEPRELRVVTIAVGHSAQDCPSEQSFTPERDQTLRVKVPRMK